MYEYIPNAIIEGSLRALITTTYFMAYTLNTMWNYADIYYFGGIHEEDYDDRTPTHAQEKGEIGDIGWEYEYKNVLTILCNYFFGTPHPESDEEDDDDDLPPPLIPLTPAAPITVPYPEKYNDLWKKKSPHFKSKEQVDQSSLKNNILFEHTPFGNVIMYYDADKTSFVYYSDKTLSYPIINSVGRKYALTFGCEALYIDKTTEPTPTPPPPEDASQKINKEHNTLHKNANQSVGCGTPIGATHKETSVYAKFKNYKKPTPSSTTTASGGTSQEDQINRYTCEGKLANFNILKKIPKVKPFSYKDFKNKLATK
jgi:hypothetical protein